MNQIEPVTDYRKVWSFNRRPLGSDICALIVDNNLQDYRMDIQWAYDEDNPRTGAVCYLVSFEKSKV